MWAARRVHTLQTAAIYFALVFTAGFAFGVVRVSLLLPALGERAAELIEAPFMLGAIVLSARWLVRRRAAAPRELLAAGGLAASFVLVADVGVGVGLRGMTLADVFIDRDPIAGNVYYVLVVLFAVLPAWLGRAQRAAPPM